MQRYVTLQESYSQDHVTCNLQPGLVYPQTMNRVEEGNAIAIEVTPSACF